MQTTQLHRTRQREARGGGTRTNGAQVAGALVLLATAAWPASALAVPPPPSGAHPRLFMDPASVAGFAANASSPTSAAAALVASCQDTIANPGSYTSRGGVDSDTWPAAAVSCAFAYRVTQNAQYLTQAVLFLETSLDDDQTMGDNQGCVAGVDTSWQAWDGTSSAPPVILTVTHDTGYPMRWYGPDVALAYDWLYGVAGVDAALLTQASTCLTAWLDYYAASGYMRAQAGANYNAGYVVGEALAAVAIGTDNGADGHLWTDVAGSTFPALLVGQGLLGASDPVGAPAGPMAGGDWAEGWQYGPLAVLEYAVAARAVEGGGVALPDMDTWASSLAVRSAYGSLPTLGGQWMGGDFDSASVYVPPSVNVLDAVLAGTSSDQAASWALAMKKEQALTAGSLFYDALAELRAVTPADFRAQVPAPALAYLARGTRALYARSGWDAGAFWSVFSSPPHLVPDHQHFAASSFVFSRGADPLVVDPSEYGEPDTFATNAVSADAAIDLGDYEDTQTPWSTADLPWARGTASGVAAARSDLAGAFSFNGTPSDIPYAHREWAMLPEGEVVTIDRVATADADHAMFVRFHTNTGGGGLALSGAVALGASGGSQVAIHPVLLSGGSPVVSQPEVGNCSVSCSYPCAACDAARFPVDEYAVSVPGPWAVAVHVIDGLATADAPATVGSMNDDATDPAPKANCGVLGAAVLRAGKQSYVVASSARQGALAATMTYAVPGGAASRHVVFDAPEDANGKSLVSVSASGGRCVVVVTAGEGYQGHPLVFDVAAAAAGCTATEE